MAARSFPSSRSTCHMCVASRHVALHDDNALVPEQTLDLSRPRWRPWRARGGLGATLGAARVAGRGRPALGLDPTEKTPPLGFFARGGVACARSAARGGSIRSHRRRGAAGSSSSRGGGRKTGRCHWGGGARRDRATRFGGGRVEGRAGVGRRPRSPLRGLSLSRRAPVSRPAAQRRRTRRPRCLAERARSTPRAVPPAKSREKPPPAPRAPPGASRVPRPAPARRPQRPPHQRSGRRAPEQPETASGAERGSERNALARETTPHHRTAIRARALRREDARAEERGQKGGKALSRRSRVPSRTSRVQDVADIAQIDADVRQRVRQLPRGGGRGGRQQRA